jgi:bacillithiol biosynthesis deacetylase BshB1
MDALFFGAHPDDIELTSAGLAAWLASRGRRVGLVDLTRGEMASRGTPETRERESQGAARVLAVAGRWSLALPDTGLDRHDRGQLEAVVRCIREHRPRLIVAPDRLDAHPDHVEASHLIGRACYLAGLARYAPSEAHPRHRPDLLLHAIYREDVRAQLIVDVTGVWDLRMAALREHASQLDPARGPETYLTRPGFLDDVAARARTWGAQIGVAYGEAYRARGPLPVRGDDVLFPETSAGGMR